MNTKTKRIIFEVGRWVCVALVLVLIISSLARDRISSADIADVEQKVVASVSLDEMQKSDNQMIKRLYGLQPSDFEECVLYAPTSNMGAEEILIIKLSDLSQQEAVRKAVENRLQTQKDSFNGYGIEQYDLLTNHSVIEVRGNYILFVVSKTAAEARRAFLGAI